MARNLVIYLPSFAGGGAERLHINLAPELIKLGYDVTFLVNLKEGALCDLLPPNVKLVCLNARNTRESIIPLYRFLREHKPDILLCNLHVCNMAGLVMKLLPWVRTKVIPSFHCTLSPIAKNNLSLSSRARTFFYRTMLNLSNAIVAVSKGVSEDVALFTSLELSRFTVIYNPVITGSFLQQIESDQNPTSTEKNARPIILGAGRFTKQKDFPTLISAFARVRARRDCRLVILGEGPLREELQDQIKALGLQDSVSLPGFIANPAASFCSADAFVLSSLYEGLGNVLIEALACGTPVVSTDCPSGPAEILENGKYGQLVPVGNAEAMAEAILSTLDNPLPKEMLRERGLYFTAERAARHYHEVFSSVMG